MVYISKLFPKPDCSSFDAFGRVFSGTVKPGDKVRVLGESYTPEDEEDSAIAQISDVWIFMGRYRIPVTKAPAGPDLCDDCPEC
jgi:116 kDa U5 small nuclear ribonucleoprotein component